MHSSFKTKPIPYAKIQDNTQLLRLDNDDTIIPEEHASRNSNANRNAGEGGRREKKNDDGRLVHQKQNNAFNKSYASGSVNTNVIEAESNDNGNKRLTHGLTSYKDIKSSYGMNNSTSREHQKSRSGSRSKLHYKLDQDLMNRMDSNTIQCTFTPKTNAGQSYKNFKDFVNFQETFLAKKEEKIEKMKKEMMEKQSANIKSIPTIDKKSRKISESSQDYRMDSYGSLKKLQKKPPIHERLYNIPRKKDRVCQDQSSFTPKILNKSKSMIRGDKVENLLYEDAQRRIGQQKLLQSQVYKKEQLATKYPPLMSSSKQSRHNNKLICKKIRSEFLQYIQADENESPLVSISPILAVTVISELFNVELNPNRNQELCWFIVSYLVKEEPNGGKGKDEKASYGEVETKRLWEFIKAIVIGVQGFERGLSCFSEEEVEKIHQQLGYFYSLRLSKLQSNRMEDNDENENDYRIETSEKTNRMAEAHRARKLEQITEFISETNILEPLSMSKGTEGSNNELEERVIRLEDLFILDSIRRKTQLEQKKLKSEEQEMKHCTFRPSLNEKSMQKAQERKARSRQNLKTIAQCNYQSVRCAQEKKIQKEKQIEKENKERSKKIIIKSKNNENRPSLAGKKQIEGEIPTCRNIKNVDKTLLRLNLARKVKDVETVHKERGYNCDRSANWLKQVQENKKQILGQVSNFLGYKDSSLQKSPRPANKSRQNYQSCQIK